MLKKDDLHASLADPGLDSMTFLNEITLRHPDAISFAPGRPYDGFFEVDDVLDLVRRYLDHLAATGNSPAQVRSALFQYGPTAGQIRGLITESLRVDEGLDVPEESVVVTVGAQEGMLLCLRALFRDPDDVLLVSCPCYVGITGAAALLDVPVVAVEEGPAGFDPETLRRTVEDVLAHGRRPRAFYVVPDHANPSGTTMDLGHRRALLDLAHRYGLLVLEDTPYRLVSPGRPQPLLKTLDRDRSVIHLGSFSKTVFPGARVGFVVADQPVADAGLLAAELTKLKSMVTVNTPSISQAVVGGALLSAGGRVSDLSAAAAAHYGRAMTTMLAELDRQLPPAWRAAHGVRRNEPEGGFFVLLEVPFTADDEALARSARDFGLLWTPMAYFHPHEGGGRNVIRLSVSSATPAEMREGTTRLARFIETEIDRQDRRVGNDRHPAPPPA